MSQYDSQIEQLAREMEDAEDELMRVGEISERSWMLIKGYCLSAIARSAVLTAKSLELAVKESADDAS
jgi:hypothetical protein